MRLVSALWSNYHPFDALRIFTSMACVETPNDLQAGDVLIVHGGADISPALYNKGLSSRGHGDEQPSKRDAVEWALMQRAKELNIPIIGICRGAQMLCALEGGYLIQHVEGHGGTHWVTLNKGMHHAEGGFNTNSIHHQQLVPKGDYELIAWTETKSKDYWDTDHTGDVVFSENPLGVDPEFVYYPAVKGFAIQWHPEMMPAKAPANQFILKFIKDHV